MTYKTEKREGTGAYPRCFENHPPLPIGDYFIHGGSCAHPMITNADIYVGFDLSMQHTDKQWPWVPGESVLYPIPDMGVPKNPEEFKAMIAWLSVQLIAKKIVHLGCIGGHGRTGLVLSALVTYMTGEKDSITYVRKHYCEKAVESSSQIKFLNLHFGITEVKGTKEYLSNSGSHGSKDWYASKGYPTMASQKMKAVPAFGDLPKIKMIAEPTRNPLCIWGEQIKFDKPTVSDTIKTIQ